METPRNNRAIVSLAKAEIDPRYQRAIALQREVPEVKEHSVDH